MATTNYWFGYWVSAEGGDLNPGQAHSWIFWGFGYGDAVAVSAHPVTNNVDERILQVENVRVEAGSGGRRLFFTVRNAGVNSIPGYGMGFSMISQ